MQKKMGAVSTLPSPQEAIQQIDAAFSFEIKAEEVSLIEAKGRVLAEDILAEEYLPVFNRSGMDGYAVIASEVQGASKENPVHLKLAGEVLMGNPAEFTLQPGTCVYTPTGAAVPEGCDAVVMVEETKKNEDGTISFLAEIESGKNVILKGSDVYPGKKVLSAGRVLNIADIGSLAALGKNTVKVAGRPLVGIISTGDELIEIEETPRSGQVRDINSVTVALAVEEAGGIAKRYGIIKDEEQKLKAQVKQAIDECDMVLISGGSSMGEKDVTEQIIESFGTLVLHGIRMKPGKPTIVGSVDGKPVIGVPGNPISAYFVTRVFVRKILQKMLGSTEQELFVEAILTKDVRENKKRSQFDFAKLSEKDWQTFAEPVRTQSGLMTSMAECDAFFITMLGSGDRKSGEKVTVHPL
ncbi:MAG: molybdopterin molybdotransferase MoeA [Parasporobacterium sp.]|nr:molybdopterin molybdotransferase MoeA [Parasporobacterium sp.]